MFKTEQIDIFLEYLDIYKVYIYFFILFSFLLFSFFKVRNIDKNENIFKIMFSEKYNKDFGNHNDGYIKDRHFFIFHFFSTILLLLIFIIFKLFHSG